MQEVEAFEKGRRGVLSISYWHCRTLYLYTRYINITRGQCKKKLWRIFLSLHPQVLVTLKNLLGHPSFFPFFLVPPNNCGHGRSELSLYWEGIFLLYLFYVPLFCELQVERFKSLCESTSSEKCMHSSTPWVDLRSLPCAQGESIVTLGFGSSFHRQIYIESFFFSKYYKGLKARMYSNAFKRIYKDKREREK